MGSRMLVSDRERITATYLPVLLSLDPKANEKRFWQRRDEQPTL